MAEILRENGELGSLEKGDLLLVLGKDEDREIPGVIDEIDANGTVWMRYGGYVTPLHDTDQIRIPPEEMRKEILDRLREANERTRKLLDDATGPLGELLEKYNKLKKPFSWFRDLLKW
ncbi:MAG TPA: hypothetical protein VMR19_00710 [Candidatus Saccharimonadales bacterium]|nr:hypothetical protein [Candidatus Saccharimonadales bacterium]